MTGEEEDKKDSNDKLLVKTPWGKLITSKGIDKIVQGFLKDVELQNRKITKLEASLKKVRELETDVSLTKDNSIKTKRAIGQLLEKFDADQERKSKTDEFTDKMPVMTETVDRLDKELTEIKEQQEKHAKRIDAIFDTIVSLMEKMERLEDLETKRRSSVKELTERLADLESKMGSPRRISDKLKTASVALGEIIEEESPEESSMLGTDIKTAIQRALDKEENIDGSD
ncbi:MAG: hypothetical protein ACFFD4_36765 [Candidatus Odinarchaeota archaeon]